jgi:hypothetical protein
MKSVPQSKFKIRYIASNGNLLKDRHSAENYYLIFRLLEITET